jgi:hypothetical protein
MGVGAGGWEGRWIEKCGQREAGGEGDASSGGEDGRWGWWEGGGWWEQRGGNRTLPDNGQPKVIQGRRWKRVEERRTVMGTTGRAEGRGGLTWEMDKVMKAHAKLGGKDGGGRERAMVAGVWEVKVVPELEQGQER